MSTWKEVLKETLNAPYFLELMNTVKGLNQTKTIYPKKEDWFNALSSTPYDQVKVVILGQDPYHQPNQAMGLAFSVKKGIKIPPSLVNIYKELEADLGIKPPNHGDLTDWTKEGVLLLNTTLTVEKNQPMSHSKLGWEQFTDAIIEALNQRLTPIVFMLWGRHAQSKAPLITNPIHYVLKAAHPSPLSAHNGFFGCKHFSKTNAYLESHGIKSIDFTIST